MKKTNKLLSLILAGTMLASSAAFTVDAKEERPVPNYSVELVFNMDLGKATATINVTGGKFGVGRYAFKYDAQTLTLVDSKGTPFDAKTQRIADAIIGSYTLDLDKDGYSDYTVNTTEETNLTENLVDTENGNVLFAWYTSVKKDENGKDIGFIDATDAKMPVATLNFTFEVENKTEEELEETKEALTSGGAIDRYQGDTTNNNGWDEEDIPDEIVVDNFEVTTGTENPKLPVNITTADQHDNYGLGIIVKWDAIPNISSYEVDIKDSDGNSLSGYPMNVSGTSLSLDKNIEYGKTYNVIVTPIYSDGTRGIGTTKVVTIENKPSSGSGSGNVSFTGGGTSSITYTVTFQAGEGTIPEGQKFKYNVALNGSVSGSPAVVAPEGKVFAGWSVDGVTLVSVEVYKIKKNTVFKAIYVDNEAYTHRPFILGYPGGEVKADAPLTRAEAATIIARASADFDSTKTYTANFSDVPADHWAANYIAFVYEKKIVTGYEDNSFHPSNNITRAEFATIMQRYLGIELNEDASFVDVNKDHWAVAYIGACKDAGLINGYENGEFRPENEITRAEAVKILNRAANRAPTPASIDKYIAEKGVPFTDLDSAKWYFYEILEAAFPHLITYYH